LLFVSKDAMAYGKGQKNMLRRSIPCGKTMLSSALLPAGKLNDVLIIRAKFLSAANRFVDAVFNPEPLNNDRSGDDIHSALTSLQKKMEAGFNKAYTEKARLAVPSAIVQVEQRYLKRLCGRLMHCATRTSDEDRLKRQYLNIPVSIQDRVTPEILSALERKMAALGCQAVIDLFRRVIVKKDTKGLTRKEAMVVRAVHAECLAKYAKPVFGADSRFSCQINLDYRVIRSRTDPVTRLDGAAHFLVDRNNRRYYYFLEISSPAPRGEPIRIPVVMTSRTLKRFDSLSKVSSLSIVINTDSLVFRAIIAKPDRKVLPDKITHIVSRDFGMVNTVCLSVAKLRDDDAIDEEKLKRISRFSKEDALNYLKSNFHTNENIVFRVKFSGRKFLNSIEAICLRIDRLKQQIDTGYNGLEKLKSIICGYLGVDEQEHLSEEVLHEDPYIRHIYRKFFRLLDHIICMKRLRIALYKKIASLKRAWFGFLTNQECCLAKKYNAALVREDLTILPKEKESPDYRGRLFNKMINNGSKGQYIRRASDKLKWDGIPELVVPSYYTSSACTVHSLVDASMRRRETFFCPECGVREHADLHAADTIANYFLLQPASQQVTLHLSKG
jgi:Putative transposase DNA-binding domain